MTDVEGQLQTLLMEHETVRNRRDEINRIREKIAKVKAKAEDAQQRCDFSIASDMLYYALPDLRNRLKDLEKKQAAEDTTGERSDTAAPKQIAEIIARWTSIPVTSLMSSEKEKLLQLEKVIEESVVGQPEAVKAVANTIRLSRSGLRNTARPIASFLMVGPSGTGKTLLSKALAVALFDSLDAMIRIDSSEYSEKHSISRLIGAPPGYVGHDSGGRLFSSFSTRSLLRDSDASILQVN
jgi:ATP-dependent Clp protease ATP-binding subunit ClpB